jgi:flagellar basal body-associated protein FliL
MNDETTEKKNSGARNILILGVASVLIALVTSLVSLYVYHKSGDIYLDCSLPDADCPSARSDSEENNRSQVYVFQDSGDIDEKVLEEYLKELETPVNRVKKLEEPFGGNALSDESLGI